jgi:HEAT repeat protein
MMEAMFREWTLRRESGRSGSSLPGCVACIYVVGCLSIIFLSPVLSNGQAKRGGSSAMAAVEELRGQLRSFILGDRVFEAEQILKKMGQDASPVLQELSKSKKTRVRTNVLELAGQLGDVESCRLILRSLDDPEEEVRNLATFQLNKCSHRELIPEMTTALEEHPDPQTRGTLSLQLGMIGSKEQIPPLRKYHNQAKDPELRHQIGLALTRLEDSDARHELVQRLLRRDQSARYGALQDCVYIQDKSLAAYFGPALEDLRNAIQVTLPEEKPTVYARICDVAVSVMAALGYKFSFSAESLGIRSPEELEEAKKIVLTLPRR